MQAVVSARMAMHSAAARAPLEARAAAQPAVPDPDAQYPMWVISMKRLLALKTVEPHQVLRSRGDLVEYTPDLGPATFVSHQHTSSSRDTSPRSPRTRSREGGVPWRDCAWAIALPVAFCTGSYVFPKDEILGLSNPGREG